jgi:hypothetical protein
MASVSQFAHPRLLRFAAMAVLLAAAAACSDDPSTTSDSPGPDSAVSDSGSSGLPSTDTSAGVTSDSLDPGLEAGTTLAPPDALDELVPGLLASDLVGVPQDWFILDLDPALVDDPAFAGDLDPFRGLVDCPSGAVRSLDAPWLARRFGVADTFLDNGVLSIEVIVHLDDASGHAERLSRLQDCVPNTDGTELVWSDSTVVDEEIPAAVGLPTDVLRIDAEPDEQTPFPYALVATWIERDGFSVTAIVGGEPPADGWDAIAERVAVDALLALEAG